jgi:hypothetical protein
VPRSDSFNYWANAEVFVGEGPEQLFSVNVVSTRWIDERRRPFPGLHALVESAFDQDAVLRWIVDRIDSIDGDSEEELLNKLCLFFEYDSSVRHWSHLSPPMEAQLDGPDDAGRFTVTLTPLSSSGGGTGTVRKIQFREDLEDLEEEWGHRCPRLHRWSRLTS